MQFIAVLLFGCFVVVFLPVQLKIHKDAQINGFPHMYIINQVPVQS